MRSFRKGILPLKQAAEKPLNTVILSEAKNLGSTHVIPAKAGIQFFRTWTPACAGVTTLIFI